MKRTIEIYLGAEDTHVGTLIYAQDGGRESSSFIYSPAWMASPDSFALCPSLPKKAGHSTRSKKRGASVFFDCFADTEPNGWGRKVILRDHAHRRKGGNEAKAPLPELNSLDFLLWVDDFSRMGALRLKDESGEFCSKTPESRRKTPPVLKFAQLIASTRAIELHQETREDLDYLRGRGSDLDGMRPKCTVIDTDGSLCLAKFPSVEDTMSITAAEILALALAGKAKIRVPDARLVNSDGAPVAVLKRFDRVGQQRKMYLSAASMLDDFEGVSDHAYSEIADAIRKYGAFAARDTEELWRRMIFNILIRNADDHLHNHGFLHVRQDQWELAPAFDINPFPDKRHVLKLWITEGGGESGSIQEALSAAPLFGLKSSRALDILREVVDATAQWRHTAKSLKMSKADIDQLGGAFEHEQRREALRQLNPTVAVQTKFAADSSNQAKDVTPAAPRAHTRRVKP